MSITIELLEERLEHSIHVNELQHGIMIEKLDLIHVDILKDLIGYNKRIEKMEQEVETLKNWRIYTIALVSIIVFISSYLIQIGLALLP